MQCTTIAAFGSIPVLFETQALKQKADPNSTLFSHFSNKTKQKPSYFSAAKKASWVTVSFGKVLPADRWKCSFLERPNERETFVKYWHSNGANGWVYIWGLCEVGNSEDQNRWPKLTWLPSVQSVDKEEWKEFTLQRSWDLVAVLPGPHTSPRHSQDRCTTVQLPATSQPRCHHPRPEAGSSQNRNIRPWRKGLPKTRVFLSPSRAPETEQTPTRQEPAMCFLYGSLTLWGLSEVPLLFISPSSPAFYSIVLERNRVSPVYDT